MEGEAEAAAEVATEWVVAVTRMIFQNKLLALKLIAIAATADAGSLKNCEVVSQVGS